MPKTQNKKGLLILEKVEFSQIRERIVGRNNDTSGKITLPPEWIGKKVYAVLVKDDKNG